MFKKTLFYSLLICLFAACGEKSAQSDQAANSENPAAQAVGGKQFGEAITADGAVEVGKLMAELEGKDSVATKLVGTVESVCQKKGCWMNVVADAPEQGEIFVKFKDYGFFMPMDINGRKVVMDGYAFKEVTSVDELRHYAEDEGKSKEEIEAINEPVEEYKFIASGVILLDQ